MKLVTKRANGTTRVQTVPEGESLAQQQFKDECDVNNIIKKYKATGTVTHVRNTANGVYADLTIMPDLQEAQQTVINAQRAFEQIPAKIRQRFNHDPNELITFLTDRSNDEEAVKLGLKTRPKPVPEDPVLAQLKELNKNTKTKKTETV